MIAEFVLLGVRGEWLVKELRFGGWIKKGRADASAAQGFRRQEVGLCVVDRISGLTEFIKR